MQRLVEAVAAVELVLGTSRAAFVKQLRDPPDWGRAHLTALAWVIDPERRSVLLVEHRHHGWSCPGGHVEPGEEPAATAARELYEETGVAAPSPLTPFTIGRSTGCVRAPAAVHWAFGYLFVVDRDVELRAEPGQPAAWFAMSGLPTPRAGDLGTFVAHVSRHRR